MLATLNIKFIYMIYLKGIRGVQVTWTSLIIKFSRSQEIFCNLWQKIQIRHCSENVETNSHRIANMSLSMNA